ncbi:MAG: sulfate transporter CysZ [Gammaproteobacteria bacterium]|nr:sulfate transporter CysZ [Gammaproteobacteria bacterium]
MLTQPFIGASYFFKGLSLLLQPRLRRFVAIPLVINISVFALILWLLFEQFGSLMENLMPSLPEWLSWLEWPLWLLFALLTVLLVFYTFSLIANLIAAPFNGLLAEAVERHLNGELPPPGGSFSQALREAPQAILDEIRKLMYFSLWIIPLLILFIIPIVNLAAPFLWALFSAWMLTLEYSDYPMGNHQLTFNEQRHKLKNRRLLSLGFGGTTLVATMIPIVNFLVMPAAVAGATAMWVERLKED